MPGKCGMGGKKRDLQQICKGREKKTERNETEGGLAETGKKIHIQADHEIRHDKKPEELCLRSRAVAVAKARSHC